MELLALALAPGIAIMWFIYSADKYEKEPLKALAISFLLGATMVIPAIGLEWMWMQLLGVDVLQAGWLKLILFSFIAIALVEETLKWSMVRFYAYPRQFFNEPFDGIVYGVMVAMGFATIENIGYVFQHGWQTGVVRMFLSVPAHATYGVLMGYYIGLAKFVPRQQRWGLKIRGLALAVLFHGVYDLFLLAQQQEALSPVMSTGTLFMIAFLSFLVAVKLSWQAIKLHQEVSAAAATSNQSIF